jgi:SAM-dependent methyltransferase
MMVHGALMNPQATSTPPHPAPPDAFAWHALECGPYAADLPLWRQLAERCGGAALELGCGAGRVALDLARAGVRVVGVDLDAALIDRLNRSAHEQGLPARGEVADIRGPLPTGEFPLVLAPMQVLQLLAGPDERVRTLREAAARLAHGGLCAAAIVEGTPDAAAARAGREAEPDRGEWDGWRYESRPLGAELSGERLVVSRLRRRTSPGGELTEAIHRDSLAVMEADELEAEGRRAGLRPVGRLRVPDDDQYVGSTIVLWEAP